MTGDRYFIRDQQAVYFLTFTIVRWLDVFTRPIYKEVIVDALNYCIKNKGMKVHAWCLMSSHLHLIASARDGYRLSDIIRDFKKFTAKEVIRLIKEQPESRREFLLNAFEEEGLADKRITQYKFWKPDNHAIELVPWETNKMDQKLWYIHNNPVEAGLVQYPEQYLFSSARDYGDEKGLVEIEQL
jgi:putative transposase